MKKLHVALMALVAVMALGAIAASTAFAADEWLIDEAPVSAETALGRIMTEGELLLVDTTNHAAVLCSGIAEGTVGPGAKDLVDEIRNLAGAVVETLDCPRDTEVVGNPCESSTPEILVLPLNLPWKSEVLLNAEGMFVDDVTGTGGEPGYEVQNCLVFGLPVKNACTGNAEVLLENMPLENDVLGIYEKVTGKCTNGDKSEITGEVLIFDLEGLLLEVS